MHFYKRIQVRSLQTENEQNIKIYQSVSINKGLEI